ncbi:MAG: 50S ribosomal protein L3 [Candidatus Margulisbacteria bacterium]|nr:50S ribosomal protein L3 [Candidatus Margulisiibacteriota bacterium]
MKELNKGLITKKIGMTQMFDDKGQVVVVTVLEACDNFIVSKKTADKNGYQALKVGSREVKEEKLTKPAAGQFKAAGKFFKKIHEIRLKNIDTYNAGEELKVDIFKDNEKVNVSGIIKGRGFTGTVKRYNFTIGPISHGSKHHRRKGTSGAGTGQAKVWKGQKTAGHYGNCLVTVKNLKIYKVMPEKKLILVKGAVPGAVGGTVKVYN